MGGYDEDPSNMKDQAISAFRPEEKKKKIDYEREKTKKYLLRTKAT